MTAPTSFEQEYYEFDGFWNPAVTSLGELDLQRVKDIFRMVPSNARSLLDVGCGNGIFCNLVNEEGTDLRIVGVDRSRTALTYVRTPKVQGDVAAMPWPDTSFDCVAALEVLEHLPVSVFSQAKREIARVAKRYIVISVPNNQVLGEGMTECPSCKTRFDPDLHVRSFSVASVCNLFAEYDFFCNQVEEIGWYSYQPGLLTVHRLLRPKPNGGMESPLCPVCGFENREYLSETERSDHRMPRTNRKSIVSNLGRTVVRGWPRALSSRWIVALYSRKSVR